jgi:hypothetical protein
MRRQRSLAGVEATLLHSPQIALVTVSRELLLALPGSRVDVHLCCHGRSRWFRRRRCAGLRRGWTAANRRCVSTARQRQDNRHHHAQRRDASRCDGGEQVERYGSKAGEAEWLMLHGGFLVPRVERRAERCVDRFRPRLFKPERIRPGCGRRSPVPSQFENGRLRLPALQQRSACVSFTAAMTRMTIKRTKKSRKPNGGVLEVRAL